MKKLFFCIMIVVISGFLFLIAPTKELVFCAKQVASASTDLKQTLDLKAKSSVLVDAKSNKILFQDCANEHLAPASMTKVMTLLLVMESIDKNLLSLDQSTTISDYAASQEGSECFLDAGQNYTILELVKSVAVASANDSCVALAEAVCGDEKLFVEKMNQRASELGMIDTHFVNCTGLDVDGHYSSAIDLTKAIRALSKYSLISELEKTWMYDMQHAKGRVTGLTNTNRLIRTNKDCYMAKTGHTDNAGYCIVIFGKRAGMELIACVMGLEQSAQRFAEAEKLLNYGFSNFESKTIVDSKVTLGEIPVNGGKVKTVKFSAKQEVSELLGKGEKSTYTTAVKLNTNSIKAPVTPGTKIGTLEVYNGKDLVEEVELVTTENVQENTYKDIVLNLLG